MWLKFLKLVINEVGFKPEPLTLRSSRQTRDCPYWAVLTDTTFKLNVEPRVLAFGIRWHFLTAESWGGPVF